MGLCAASGLPAGHSVSELVEAGGLAGSRCCLDVERLVFWRFKNSGDESGL